MILRRLPLLAVVLLVAGCSSFDSLNPFASSGPKMAELVPLQPSAEIATVWKENLGKSDNYVFTPAIIGTAVFAAGGKGEVIRVEEGAVRWKSNVGMALSGGVGSDGRRVVVGSPKGDIIALDAADGKEIWRARVTSEVIAAPAVSGKLVVVLGDPAYYRRFGFRPAKDLG